MKIVKLKNFWSDKSPLYDVLSEIGETYLRKEKRHFSPPDDDRDGDPVETC